MSYDLQPLLRSFAAKQNQENARAMSRYMRDQFPFFGIKLRLRNGVPLCVTLLSSTVFRKRIKLRQLSKHFGTNQIVNATMQRWICSFV
ncbi:hypothetical protein NBRC111894_2278 [Sporolactobacillus inulinus]|uniref:Uncharacterized protein n=1 Tax=Sporolactobacillus inulinus TaxID=2078 RepID=A0A4Y1ZCI4_9BACL|nr:hypothetical protein NBRC111894_2278 [Sporolactobacillus inulinus]